MTKEQYKSHFKKALTAFAERLQRHVTTKNGEWSVKSFIDAYKNIYTISSDTKIISKILEIHIFPQIVQYAEEVGYNVILAEHQNYYPDLTFVNKSDGSVKFAVDLKTSYRKKNGIARFTLGSHGSYFKERDKQKNIQFPYNQYLGHYCLGVIYTRNEASEREVASIDNLKSITSVIRELDFFVAEKWKIAGDRQGSSNTANIGCALNLNDLKNENGIFSRLGEEWFDEYWVNYGSAMMPKDGKMQKITNIRDFLEFKGRADLLEKVSKKKVSK
jgi:hypothetical protein